jgi:hypothetical protein
MGTSLFTSAKRRPVGGTASKPALVLTLLFLGGISLLRAGTIITLTGGAEIDGKLSVGTAGLHADSASNPPDTALADILEANFGDDPFQLNSFFPGKGTQLPPNWVAQDIGEVGTPGSATVQDGTFTLNGAGASPGPKNHGQAENLFFVGRPWTDNGEFTARIDELDAHSPELTAGLIFKDTLDPDSPMYAVEVNSQGTLRFPIRHEKGSNNWGRGSTANVPLWLRFTRFNNQIYTSISNDGSAWDIVEQSAFKTLQSPFAGLFVDSHKAKQTGTAVFDQISVTPLPSSARVLQPGVVLQGGSLLAGHFNHISFDPASPAENGELERGEKNVSVPRSQISGVIMLPMDRSLFTDTSSKVGVVMRNGDLMDGDLSSISREEVSVNSVLLGLTTYKSTEVRACFVQPLQPQPAAFEVRLRDGSIINATAISGDATEALLTDVSGYTIQTDQSDIAQIRAGTAVVQDLAPLNWKATPPPAAAAPAPANGAAAPTPAPPANPANAAPPANLTPPPPPPLVQSWLGKNMEQILETSMGTAIEFPLPGKFRALGVQVALSSDAPPNATINVHVLVDGQEVGKSPFRAGDPPRFLEVTFQNPAHVTLVADSMYPGVSVLYLDPVAIRN